MGKAQRQNAQEAMDCLLRASYGLYGHVTYRVLPSRMPYHIKAGPLPVRENCSSWP